MGNLSVEFNSNMQPILHDDRAVGWLARALDAEMYRGLNPFDFFKTQHLLFFNMAFVHPDYAKSGILFDMYQLAARTAMISHNIGAGIGTASGNYSAKASVKAGGKILRTLNYSTFQLPDGTRPFSRSHMGGHDTRFLVAGLPPLNKNVHQ